MADEKPIEGAPEDLSKKDTVRINLPTGGLGKPTGASPTPTVRLKPAAPKAPANSAAPAAASDDEAKKETAVMGTPISAPAPKKDTSRVQVPAPKPAQPETPRPTVKLKREEPATPPSAPAPAPVAPVAAPAGAAISGLDVGLAIAAMIMAIVVAGYLLTLAK